MLYRPNALADLKGMGAIPPELAAQPVAGKAPAVWARGRCRISPPRFLAECCKRQLNQGSFVLLYLGRLLFLICIEFVFSYTVLFVSISQVIGCEDRLQNDLYCVEWGVKLYSNQTKCTSYRVQTATANE